ncbi:MAG: 2-oxoisovalerate dehydrogenase [Candidatus Dormibacteria bacterium]
MGGREVPECYRSCLASWEIVLAVDEAPEGGYIDSALGESIVTEADDTVSRPEIGPDAVICHVDEAERPQVARRHLVRDEVLAL